MYTSLYKYARLASPEGRVLHRHLQELLRTQWLPREELEALQLARLKLLLDHAYVNVPFYRHRFQEAGIHPGDIGTLDDLRRIPILTRDDVRQNRESLIAGNFPPGELQAGVTSGSTGAPLRFYNSREHLRSGWSAFSRIYHWYGLEKGCKQAVIAGTDAGFRPTFFEKTRMRLRRERWLSCFDMQEDKLRAYAEDLARFRPEVFWGYNSALWWFAKYVKKRGLESIRPKVIVGGVDKLYDFQRELIEETFACRVVNYYSAQETGIMAGQCPEGSLHLSAELHYLELINNGRPAEPGGLGDIIVTDLHNYAMPFIRYRIGDVGRFEDRPCRCGRGLPVLGELVGRTSDFFTTPDGRVISGILFLCALQGWPGANKYQVTQPSVDKIDIVFEADDDLDMDWLESQREELQAHLGNFVELSITKVEQIPLTPAGKFLFTSSAVPLDLGKTRTSEG
ncbi:MAG: hypothetical protein M1358_11465 [Chloroflexi bacterium]|nr:hypothetical protein [Chloroflexota bacterium]